MELPNFLIDLMHLMNRMKMNKAKTFEEEFPSLEGKWLSLQKYDIEVVYGPHLTIEQKLSEGIISLGITQLKENCLDKQRVRETFEAYVYDIRIIRRKLLEIDGNLKDYKKTIQSINDLEKRHKLVEKELGLLEDEDVPKKPLAHAKR